MTYLVPVLLGCLVGLEVSAAPFQNLDFEQANTNRLMFAVEGEAAGFPDELVPGWRIIQSVPPWDDGTFPGATNTWGWVPFNPNLSDPLLAPPAFLTDQDPLELAEFPKTGTYSLFLGGGTGSMSLIQQGSIPPGATNLVVDGAFLGFPGSWQAFINGFPLSGSPLSGWDVAQFAGQPVQFRFTSDRLATARIDAFRFLPNPGPVELLPVAAATMSPALRIGVSFSKPLSLSSATNLAHYTVSATNATITQAQLMPDQMTVALSLSRALLDIEEAVLTVDGLHALDGTVIAQAASVPVRYGGGMDSWEIGVMPPEGAASFAVTPNQRDFAILARGVGIGGTNDSFHFLASRTSWRWFGWDIGIAYASRNTRTQAGIMAREDLTPGSRNVCIAVAPANGRSRVSLTYRETPGGPTLPWPGTTGTLDMWAGRIELARDGDTYIAAATDLGGRRLILGEIKQVYPSAIHWGFATAGEGQEPGSPAFVSYMDLGNQIGDPSPFVFIHRQGSQIVLTWSNLVLQSSDQISGPWEDVPGATSPFTVPTTGSRKFYRLR